MFYFRHINRVNYPQKHVLVCEDDLNYQASILKHFQNIFEPQGDVQFSIVSGGLYAASIISQQKVDLIILDHDMPHGSGSDLLTWLKQNNNPTPVITFSGIHNNNQHMINQGATYLFSKSEVIDGKADSLIKSILNIRNNYGIAEFYVNKVCVNTPTSRRYWITPKLMVGGSICDIDDWQHIKNDYCIGAVINTETEHSDINKGIDHLCEVQIPDNGTPFPIEYVKRVVLFAKEHFDKILYVHCQMGGSRSPAFAYAILRYCYQMNPQAALAKINEQFPKAKINGEDQYGVHPYHKTYLASVEATLIALADLEKQNNENKNIAIAERYINTISPNNSICNRFWVNKNIMVGGNICNQNDLNHLKKDFGIQAIINVDGLQNHAGAIENLLQFHVNDDGDPFPTENIKQVIEFASKHKDKKIYIHCHMGRSRSAHFAYAILRGVWKLSSEEAYQELFLKMPEENKFWFNRHTKVYVESIEKYLLGVE